MGFIKDITDVLKQAFAKDWKVSAVIAGTIVLIFGAGMLCGYFIGKRRGKKRTAGKAEKATAPLKEEGLSASVSALYRDIECFASEGGDYAALQKLYNRLIEQKNNPANLDGVNQKKLAEAADILTLLIDAAQ